ncbi:hypothetical protein [Sphingomonas panacis]|uniref:hypothetical protein n=1 Tax=Sphingomonas panacis TaxID=1560345 RepID=UPI001F0A7FA5|nr:hypothetical protein [Sphingomonas panacis]
MQTIIAWMATEGLSAFRLLTPSVVGQLVAWLRARPGAGTRGTLKPTTVGFYLNVINTMYLQRAKLEDSPMVNPVPGSSTSGLAGVCKRTAARIPFIPDPVAVDLLSKALDWVENHSATIIAAIDLAERTYRTAAAEGWKESWTRTIVNRALAAADIPGADGVPLTQTVTVRRAGNHLTAACFALIAGLVGMRASEILSMQVDAVELMPIGETGLSQAYVVARLFKTSQDPRGSLERWIAPQPVVSAIDCLARLAAVLRADTKGVDLFIVKDGFGAPIEVMTNHLITWRLQQFAEAVDTVPHEGRTWEFSSHQFRKTFARFIARGDRTQLLALADHFKHASVAMTSRGYVGTDFELHQLINEESRNETAWALDRILASESLGGRMGERIAAGNHGFRGRAGEEVRRDYVDFVLAETDLHIRGCDYGWCVFQPEVAVCGGEIAPNEALRSPSACSSCPNLVVEPRHAGYWQERRTRNQALWERASPLARASLAETIGECDRMLRRIQEVEGV